MGPMTAKPWNLTSTTGISVVAVFEYCPYGRCPIGRCPVTASLEASPSLQGEEITEAVTREHPVGFASQT